MTTAASDRLGLIGEWLKGKTAEFGHGFELTASDYLSVTCEALSALAGHVTREYGDYGYSFESIRAVTHAVVLAQVKHSDGSRFVLAADRYGNVRRLDNSSRDQMASEITGMHEHAVTP